MDEADKLVTDFDVQAQMRDIMIDFLRNSKGDKSRKILLYSATYGLNFKWILMDLLKGEIEKDEILESYNYGII